MTQNINANGIRKKGLLKLYYLNYNFREVITPYDILLTIEE